MHNPTDVKAAIQQFKQTKFTLKVDLMQAETPNISIADSLMCVDNLKQEMTRLLPPSKF